MYSLLLTREEKDNLESKKIFSSYGINTISLPMIEIVPKAFELSHFDFKKLIFSSKKAVEIFFQNVSICKNANIDIYVVGQKTKESLLKCYDKKNVVMENTIKDILPKINQKSLWVRTDFELPEDIQNMLKDKDIYILKAYETRLKTYDLNIILENIEKVNGVFFGSPSAFIGLLKNLQNYKYILNEKDIFAIGNTTANTIKNEGISVTYVPKNPSLEKIAEYIARIGT
ncbi:uroporphyrinogen-III synthase [Hydrogenobaculum acidophilum]